MRPSVKSQINFLISVSVNSWPSRLASIRAGTCMGNGAGDWCLAGLRGGGPTGWLFCWKLARSAPVWRQKRAADGPRLRQLKEFCQGSRDICIGRPDAQIMRFAIVDNKKWDLLPRVVGSAKSWVI